MITKFTRKDFLEALFHDYFKEREGFIMVKTVRHLDHKVSTRYFPNAEILSREPYQEDQQVYFGVCPREKMKPDKHYIRYLVALWAGLDLGPEGYSGRHRFFSDTAQAAKAIRSFPLPPSIIVESGSGVHVYWLLKYVTHIRDVEMVEALLRKISGYFQCKTDVEIDSVLRLPGTANCKNPTQSVTCNVKYINLDFRYDIQEFRKLIFGVVASPVKTDQFSQAVKDNSAISHITARDAGASRPAASSSLQAGNAGSDWMQEPYEPPGLGSPEPPKSGGHVGSLGASQSLPPSGVANALEPPQEGASELATEQTVVVLAEESTDLISDEIVDKVVEKLTKQLMGTLVDEIVDRLIERLTPNHR